MRARSSRCGWLPVRTGSRRNHEELRYTWVRQHGNLHSPGNLSRFRSEKIPALSSEEQKTAATKTTHGASLNAGFARPAAQSARHDSGLCERCGRRSSSPSLDFFKQKPSEGDSVYTKNLRYDPRLGQAPEPGPAMTSIGGAEQCRSYAAKRGSDAKIATAFFTAAG